MVRFTLRLFVALATLLLISPRAVAEEEQVAVQIKDEETPDLF